MAISSEPRPVPPTCHQPFRISSTTWGDRKTDQSMPECKPHVRASSFVSGATATSSHPTPCGPPYDAVDADGQPGRNSSAPREKHVALLTDWPWLAAPVTGSKIWACGFAGDRLVGPEGSVSRGV